ncbi:hypothetical protein J6590_066289 [Homalodisca vitripennis]|nr:hypothetical protein J6590_066289 [Homalodisca vitripennis]
MPTLGIGDASCRDPRGKIFDTNLIDVLLEKGEASSEPASPIKAGREWQTLMSRLARDFDSSGTPPTPAVISRSRHIELPLQPQNLDICG